MGQAAKLAVSADLRHMYWCSLESALLQLHDHCADNVYVCLMLPKRCHLLDPAILQEQVHALTR